MRKKKHCFECLVKYMEDNASSIKYNLIEDHDNNNNVSVSTDTYTESIKTTEKEVVPKVQTKSVNIHSNTEIITKKEPKKY